MEIFNEERLLNSKRDDLRDLKEIKIVGTITKDLTYHIPYTTFSVVDISEAEFIEEYKDEYVCMGYSHYGPVYSDNICHRLYDHLDILLKCVYTEKIIVPPAIKRRHINTIKRRNKSIKEVIVTDDCKLFSMKDGDVYNKKGTILTYSNKQE